MISFLDFEKPIAELEARIHDLRQLDGEQEGGADIEDEVGRLQAKADELLRETYGKLTPWQKVQVARHPDRPQFKDFVAGLIDGFVPLAGDRAYADDKAIAGGIGRFQGRSVMVIGHEKGSDMQSRVRHNFGMARPEGYRKAVRLMRLADRFGLPIITLVDTQGAYPGVGAEERGQAEAIARSTETCLDIRVPLICCVVGEGGSGGAVALASGNAVLMLEHAVYSVISPEGCASILWHSSERAQDAADAMKVTAQDLIKLQVVDTVVEEAIGGAHRNPASTIAALGDAIAAALAEFDGKDGGYTRQHRRDKFLAMGQHGI
ncbi:MAG: acetyl-CoA carboxylase carboxyl transferase subunit alpha [Rhodospirillaceae bacterium]|nr:acetyl-CoA carboxylase carboxyl transferase subunit alpha [Rhodospirillaceae bacterium]